jgi:hypothetical protein
MTYLKGKGGKDREEIQKRATLYNVATLREKTGKVFIPLFEHQRNDDRFGEHLIKALLIVSIQRFINFSASRVL